MELEIVKYINLKELVHQFATIESKKKIFLNIGIIYIYNKYAFILMTFINQTAIISWCH